MQSLDRVEDTFSQKNNKTKQIPEFKAGDKVVVKSKIKEGDKERVQAFEGVVIARAGRGPASTFTVRKVSGGVGVERIFPLYSPNLVSIERKTEGFVRRAKLYYIRGLEGKASRIQDKNIRLMEAQGAGTAQASGASTANAKATAPTTDTESTVDAGQTAQADTATEKKPAKKTKK